MHLPLSLLLLLVAGAAVVCVAVTSTLHGFRGCAVREFSFVAQKPGCTGLRITTEACWGRCHTWEVTSTHTAHPSAAISERLCNAAIVKHEVNDERPGTRPKPREGRQPILGSDPSAIVIRSSHPSSRTFTELILVCRDYKSELCLIGKPNLKSRNSVRLKASEVLIHTEAR